MSEKIIGWRRVDKEMKKKSEGEENLKTLKKFKQKVHATKEKQCIEHMERAVWMNGLG